MAQEEKKLGGKKKKNQDHTFEMGKEKM